MALVAAACADGHTVDDAPTCFLQPFIPIRATSGSLAIHVTPTDLACPDVACLEHCPVVEEIDGVEFAICRPEFREDGTPASDNTFVVDGDHGIGWDMAVEATRRVVRIAATDPDLTFTFELPDVRSLEGEHAWSSPVHWVRFRSGRCAADDLSDDHLATGTLRVISRTGGADAETFVTDDYHVVVEVSGRVEAVPGGDRERDCLALPATDFSFTFEEDEVGEDGWCLL